MDDVRVNSRANAENAKAIAPLLKLAAQRMELDQKDVKTNSLRKKMDLDVALRANAAAFNMSVDEYRDYLKNRYDEDDL